MIERLEATVDHVLTCQTQALKIGRSLAPNHQYYRVGAPGLSGAPRRHAKVTAEIPPPSPPPFSARAPRAAARGSPCTNPCTSEVRTVVQSTLVP